MSSHALDTNRKPRPTREEALKIAGEHKAARRLRTSRLRKTVAALAVVAFVGPFGAIYQGIASGKDPGLATQAAAPATSGSSGGASTSSGSTTTATSAQTSSPAPVTTQQS
jgi:hypothetical protein